MKKYKLIFLFLLLSFTSQAQHKYPFYKAQDTINTILAQNPKAYYIGHNGLNKKIKSIKVNENGRLKIIDAVYSEVDSAAIVSTLEATVFIDLFAFEKLKINTSSVQLLDKNNKVYGTIYEFEKGDIIKFSKQIEYLKEYCIRNRAIEFIKSYYFDFRTGYDFDGKFLTITDNYKVILNESQFTVTFDTFENNSKSSSVTVSFNLKDIIAIEPNGGDIAEIIGSETLIIPLNGKLLFTTAKDQYNLNIYYEVDEDVTQTEIYKAFNSLWSLFKH